MRATGMFIQVSLLLSCFYSRDTRLMALSQCIERFDTATLFKPFLLPGSRLLMRLRDEFPRLADCCVQAVKERLIIVPLASCQPVASGGNETLMVFVAILG